ncbi:MAG: dockerin type I repeat-containing protein [Ruminococcus sp.]|nr:dockerin type I repeat-containing protein [Ruminococcus sp.]
MKKTKIFAMTLAAVLCAEVASFSGFSADALASFCYDLEFLEDYSDYTFVTYTGGWTGTGYRPRVIYQKIGDGYTDIISADLLEANITTLKISEDGLEIYQEIYTTYEAELDFEYYSESELESLSEEDDTQVYSIHMYDKPITETISTEPVDFTEKYDTLTAMCSDLEDAGVLVSAQYIGGLWTWSPGGSDQTFTITGVPEDEMEQMQEIVSAYDDDAVVTADGTTYTIKSVEDYTAYNALGNALRTAYPDAYVDGYLIIAEEANELQTASIDLLAKEITLYGDMDGDEEITVQDAYTCMCAFAEASAGNDDGLTDSQRTAADVDGDGEITMQDAYLIQMYAANVAAGKDVTWDDLIG